MNTADTHRGHAVRALAFLRDSTFGDTEAHIFYGTEATAHALLAIEARLGEIVEQQRLSNVNDSVGLDLVDPRAADSYMRTRLARIVNGETESDSPCPTP